MLPNRLPLIGSTMERLPILKTPLFLLGFRHYQYVALHLPLLFDLATLAILLNLRRHLPSGIC